MSACSRGHLNSQSSRVHHFSSCEGACCFAAVKGRLLVSFLSPSLVYAARLPRAASAVFLVVFCRVFCLVVVCLLVCLSVCLRCCPSLPLTQSHLYQPTDLLTSITTFRKQRQHCLYLALPKRLYPAPVVWNTSSPHRIFLLLCACPSDPHTIQPTCKSSRPALLLVSNIHTAIPLQYNTSQSFVNDP